MKISQIMLSKGFGGAERYFVDLCLALTAAGHQVQAICHPKFQQQGLLEHCPQLTLSSARTYGPWDRWAAHKIKRRIASFQPTLIHTHLARGAWIGGKIAANLDVPSLVNIHNYVKLKRYTYIDTFIPSTIDQEKFLINEGISPEKIVCIPHFSRLQPVDTPHILTNNTPVFATLGRFVKKKGMDVLLRAFAHYINQGGQAKLRIGGAGEEEEALFRLCQDLHLSKQVEFCGWINDISEFLSQADIFILPSLHEAFGIVVLEAMALGVLIITTRTQGPLEILNPEAAYFVEVGDSIGLAKAMAEAAAHPQLAHQKAATALALFKDKYTLAAVLPKILQLYQTIEARSFI
ncbi:glycosyl transferase family protein [Candidatus Nitrosoglobus terrae]|uniref:Glycosyl transferase family protein n=1 Tax=Candidatus Nitrosoglobus terrae TaxID=1630141 RepID=A0A1Q2SP75_9GAMM|nr:glycosyltransferase [Candidatus Nitrosoglobus terrae]BAW80965.1 glycosyl transferase family protein [Candidatus Nitrosoglobus terrae]